MLTSKLFSFVIGSLLEHGQFFEKLRDTKKDVLRKSNFIIALGINLFTGSFIQLLTLSL